jgi:tetratricopeptide (TPR) repeat protein
VHNIVFDWWVAGGTLGLLTYLSIFVAALWVLWRSGAFTVAERAILTGLLAGYFCHNFFVFDNVTSYILFGTILAFIVYRHTEHEKKAPIIARGVVRASALPYVAIGAVLFVWLLAWGVNAKPIAQNRALLSALATQGDLNQTLELFKKAIAYQSFGTQETREQLAQGSAQIAQANVPVETKKQFYDLSSSEMQLQMAASELDARFPLFLGVLYDAYGDYQNGAIALDHAQTLSPRKQSIFFERAQNAELRGDVNRAIALYKEAHELAPEMKDPRIIYASVLIRNGRAAEADAVLEPLIASGEAADQRILSNLVTVKDYARIGKIWAAYTAAHPEDVQGFFTLAAVYYEAGDRNRAIATLESAAELHPDVRAQVVEIITQIRNGTVR